MSEEEKNLIVNHDYDGIREFDNPLPGWWLMTFLGTIIFAFLYFIHYEFSGGQTIAGELKEDLARIEATKSRAPVAKETEEDLAKLRGVVAVEDSGKALYQAKCAACHGPQLQGVIGPNLTDEFWLHGQGRLVDISMVIRKGVLDKGMPKWDELLKDEEIKAVTVFVASQSGTNPPNPRPPQGEKFVRP